LNAAFRHLRAGAQLIALQKGRYFVRSDGEYLDTGAFVELLQYASGQTALLMGKPSPSFFELALREVDCAPEETLVVGDDVSTDIAGAHAIGARSVLVRTGKFDPDRLGSAPPPTEVLNSVADLHDLLARWRQ
jgi:ribonucleotide monophosphatase NagD (HAD superfamily)